MQRQWPQAFKIEVQPLHLRLFRVGKVDGDDVADRRGRLIHQAAGLSEIDVLRILADLRDLHRCGGRSVEKHVDDRPQQHLKGRGAGKSAARQHRRGHIGVKALELTSELREPRRYAAHQRRRRVLLLRAHSQLVQRHLTQGIPLRQDADRVPAIFSDRRARIEIDRRRQHTAVLMIGVIAAQLCPSRR